MQSRVNESSRLVSALQVVIGGHVFAAGVATYFGNDTWYSKYLMPTLHRLIDPETAHRWAVRAAHYGLVKRPRLPEHPELKCSMWKINFNSPVGLAAGFDKNAEAVDGMLRLGFGFVEVGTVTPEPQPGNDKPRLFRLREDKAVINRYGFNSEGFKAVLDRLTTRNMEPFESGVVGVNIGKNKTSTDAIGDYVRGVETFSSLADYIVINISSPNTEGLRDLQHIEHLEKLISKVVNVRDKLPGKKPPLLVKISPDLTTKQKEDIASVILRKGRGIAGLVVCNTTVSRPDSLRSEHKSEQGGLSGQPLRDLATSTIKDMYRLTKGAVPIIGVGGISTGQDAYEKIRAGASLVQLYTSFIYEGPPVVKRVTNELAQLLRDDGFTNISQAVGIDAKK